MVTVKQTITNSPERSRGLRPLWIRFTTWVEYWIVSRLTPKRVGPVMRLVFKIPILFYRLGLGSLMGGKILLLTTRGRKTGKPRVTALEYGYDPANDTYFLMSGWAGRSDWYRNSRANPNVQIWVGKRRFAGLARPATGEEVVNVMLDIMRINPKAINIWSSFSGMPYDGTRESLYRMAVAFPSLVVHPKDPAEAT